MSKNMIIIIAVFVVATLGFIIRHSINKPGTYEDCVLENIKNTTNSQASIFVAKACREKFPLPSMTDQEFFGKK